jgi:predicted nuclease of predicted toxin-antitoxin system
MLRILANENIPLVAIEGLREAGHDVAWVFEKARGADDGSVLALAQAEARLILTFDKDFGELVYQRGKDASAGVVLLRISTKSPAIAARRIVNELAAHADELAGSFTVIGDQKVRVVRLPPGRADGR